VKISTEELAKAARRTINELVIRPLMAWLDARLKWLDLEIRNGGNLEHLTARYAECRYIREKLPQMIGTSDESPPIPPTQTRREAFLAWWKSVWAPNDPRSTPGFDAEMERWSWDAWRAGSDYERERLSVETSGQSSPLDLMECPVSKQPCNCQRFCKMMRGTPASSEKAIAPLVVERPPLQFICQTCDYPMNACVCGNGSEKASD
jgi:hypothetical protein